MVPTQDNPTENVEDLISPSILKKSTSRNEKKEVIFYLSLLKVSQVLNGNNPLRFLLMR